MTDPFLINVSGGRTSALMLRRYLDANGGRLPEHTHAACTKVVCFNTTADNSLLRSLPAPIGHRERLKCKACPPQAD